ncbi:hypothetical protein DV515_00002587 [Chloebia gouldiae]|uniref:Uncharacterized protein n=1 Tax=Chloebia gouldiae TaxID=44316 RepID=A0A3L8SUS7_CHLGU|nr:hypothetical protein DV515_00002587 [Chloebia gouldiae]
MLAALRSGGRQLPAPQREVQGDLALVTQQLPRPMSRNVRQWVELSSPTERNALLAVLSMRNISPRHISVEDAFVNTESRL